MHFSQAAYLQFLHAPAGQLGEEGYNPTHSRKSDNQ